MAAQPELLVIVPRAAFVTGDDASIHPLPLSSPSTSQPAHGRA